MDILVISDIHANFPALQAIDCFFPQQQFSHIINCGDSLVYGPFPNETLAWLRAKNSLSILGNTDKKVLKILRGKPIAKPSDPEKRIMYTWTAEQLSKRSIAYLETLKNKTELTISDLKSQSKVLTLGIFHGSPEHPHEFLFDTTPQPRFCELARLHPHFDVILTGHSHTPYHKKVGSTHFVNPGSIGRMFDGDSRGSCAVLSIDGDAITVQLYRIGYDIEQTIRAIEENSLPEIYCTMYRTGRKIN